MAKAVFTTKSEPTYDDLPEERYHFPKTYLRQVEATVGDWIVYYEPRRRSSDPSSRGGRQAYFATAKVERISPDPRSPDHYYAFVSQFLPFDRAVGFREGERFFESQLQRADGGTSKGAFGRAVRPIGDSEFEVIVQAGFRPVLEATLPRSEKSPSNGLHEEIRLFDRPLIERLVARPFRDAAFSLAVKSAYEATCAVTELRIINGAGRSEVQAAHIRPVADRGPDSVRNGIALCGTVHWMFDRGLISFDDDYTIMLARDRVPDAVQRLINPERRLKLPIRAHLRPHPQFMRYHRENIFKG
jgi:putative restriction endonuclease